MPKGGAPISNVVHLSGDKSTAGIGHAKEYGSVEVCRNFAIKLDSNQSRLHTSANGTHRLAK